MTEHKTSFGFCGWYKTKDGFINEFVSSLNTLQKQHQWNCKVICGNNAGENKSFLEEINGKHWKMGVEANWTPRATPQPNCTENPIYVVCMQAGTLHAAANVPDKHKNILFPQAVIHSHIMRRLEVIKIDGVSKSRFEHLFGQNLPIVKYMQP